VYILRNILTRLTSAKHLKYNLGPRGLINGHCFIILIGDKMNKEITEDRGAVSMTKAVEIGASSTYKFGML
jgi:hypothetical protein